MAIRMRGIMRVDDGGRRDVVKHYSRLVLIGGSPTAAEDVDSRSPTIVSVIGGCKRRKKKNPASGIGRRRGPRAGQTSAVVALAADRASLFLPLASVESVAVDNRLAWAAMFTHGAPRLAKLAAIARTPLRAGTRRTANV